MESTFDDYGCVLGAVEHGFGGGRVLVVGDLMLDRYVWGDVTRVSPEAPVPVVLLRRKTVSLGGAANVAANLARLGLDVCMGGVVGADAGAEQLMSLLEAEGIRTNGVIRDPSRSTTTKTRVLGGHQQIMRLDEEDVKELQPEIEGELLARAMDQLETSLVVILSDYAKGTLSSRACRVLISEARERGIPVLVDPKVTDFSRYAGATAITPNTRELGAAARMSIVDSEDAVSAAIAMRNQLGIEALILTQGEQGITVCDGEGARNFPAVGREVFDVSGAGDTVIATIGAGIVAQLRLDDAVRLANVAAGVVVGKVGTVPLHRQELSDALQAKRHAEQARKIMDRGLLRERVAEWRARGERIVFTNGCFDIIHAGHVTYLERARSEGHRLVVGLNSDRSVQALKGSARPIMPEADRARVLASLESVDAVVIFDEDVPLDLILFVRPDVLVKGDDYQASNVVGAREIKGWMGKLVLVPMVEGRSTTHIVRKIKEVV